jgi:protein-disulfide isomerase
MTQEAKVLAGIVILTVVIITVGAILVSKSGSTTVDFSKQKPVDKKFLVPENSFYRGQKNAKVTVVEFADFQCPACGTVNPVLNQLEKEYQKKVMFIYRHYPLPQHKNAMIAALAAEAAGEKGKFWQMHDKLFDKQNEWSESLEPLKIFDRYGQELKLDITQFNKAIKENKFSGKINQDVADGNTIAISSTPTFYVNGYKIESSTSLYEQLKSVIDSQLKS